MGTTVTERGPKAEGMLSPWKLSDTIELLVDIFGSVYKLFVPERDREYVLLLRSRKAGKHERACVVEQKL